MGQNFKDEIRNDSKIALISGGKKNEFYHTELLPYKILTAKTPFETVLYANGL